MGGYIYIDGKTRSTKLRHCFHCVSIVDVRTLVKLSLDGHWKLTLDCLDDKSTDIWYRSKDTFNEKKNHSTEVNIIPIRKQCTYNLKEQLLLDLLVYFTWHILNFYVNKIIFLVKQLYLHLSKMNITGYNTFFYFIFPNSKFLYQRIFYINIIKNKCACRPESDFVTLIHVISKSVFYTEC